MGEIAWIRIAGTAGVVWTSARPACGCGSAEPSSPGSPGCPATSRLGPQLLLVEALLGWTVAVASASECCWNGFERNTGGCTLPVVKTMIDLDDEALALAARELGTATKKDTVNAALAFVAERRRRIAALLEDPLALGVGPDIADAEIMRHARR